ncbi:hypothetical protein ABZ023_18350 [Streptomyces sp. NPDC006367]|uniref:hypothetical protein n=1 Tax=unclassified Streptomyces TaxID=2593676 RepID=UPI0033BED730
MSEQDTDRPINVIIRVPAPVPATELGTVAELAQQLADRLGAGTLVMGKHFWQAGNEFVFSIYGHAPTNCESGPDEEFVRTTAHEEAFRIQ